MAAISPLPRGSIKRTLTPDLGAPAHYAFVQVQALPQRHCEPQPQDFAGFEAWQPHLQPAPGQVLQRQAFDFALFMTILLGIRG